MPAGVPAVAPAWLSTGTRRVAGPQAAVPARAGTGCPAVLLGHGRDDVKPRPVVFGYVRLLSATDGAGTARSALGRFTEREGLVLGQVFVEADRGGPRIALASLIEAMSFHEVAAIVVPGLHHLGDDDPAQAAARARIEREAGVPVLVVEPPS